MIRSLPFVIILMVIAVAGAHESLRGPTELIHWDQQQSFHGYTLFSTRGTSYLIDMEGRVVNTWPIGTTPQLLENGNLLDASKDDPSGFGGFRELDWNGNVVWQYDEQRPGYKPHHDWVRIFNKQLGQPTTLYIANREITHQEAIDAGCDPANGPYDGAQLDTIVEIDMQGNIVWEWRFFDHTIQDVDPTKRNYIDQGKTVADYPHRINVNIPGRPVKRDWLHCNSLDYNPQLGHVVTNSVQGEFYVIDHDGTFVAGDPEESIRRAAGPAGDFLYRFGDPARYGQGDPPSILADWTQSTTGHKQIGGAHDVHWIDKGLPGAGNFLIFNNAQYLFERTPQSYVLEINGMVNELGERAEVYVNPPDAGYFRWQHPNRDSQKTPRWVSNQIVWMYYSRSNQGFFSHIGSGAQRLPNGNTLVCAMTEGHFFEVTPDAEIVWEYINPVTKEGVVKVLEDSFPMSNAVFRAYRYGPDHPALRDRELQPKGTLTELASQGQIQSSPRQMPQTNPRANQPGQKQNRQQRQPGTRTNQNEGQRGPSTNSESKRPTEATQLNPETEFQFTEGPVGDADGNIYFTDVRANRIYRRDPTGQLEVFLEDSGGANGLAIDAEGDLVICQGERSRVARLSKDGKLTTLADKYAGKPFNKPNDLWIAPNGGVYFSDPLYGRGTPTQDGQHVYYITPAGDSVIRVADDLVRPNGLVGSADGKTLFITDHGADRTYRYAIQTDGLLADKSVFAEIGADGMAIDSRGNVYLASQQIVVFNSLGKQTGSFPTPEQPTNVCLTKDESELFVTARSMILSIPLAEKRN
ncbi:Gluconolactonase precursor [Novipirellula aureliae]|uniref:Gluconolactonase n=1 Tax=Novipirellula aureliae TaxID=2527966 RepID=A0A5C6EC47_9BACT|nr:SMP-30/gluconolactonase/LRE family protein [Novipirellula aureliae]TWU45106.1 Gluconolactonase precursor [Novipirellula aureliae]